jgi:hypothetical protein
MDTSNKNEPTFPRRESSSTKKSELPDHQVAAKPSDDDGAVKPIGLHPVLTGAFSSLVRGGRWVVTAALGATIALGVARGLGDLGQKPIPIPAQLNRILADAARQGLEPVYMRELDLQGTGSMARLVVLRPRLGAEYVNRSDELRVYETVNQELKSAFVALCGLRDLTGATRERVAQLYGYSGDLEIFAVLPRRPLNQIAEIRKLLGERGPVERADLAS